MIPHQADVLRAIDDLEHVYRVLFEWHEVADEGEAQRMMRRALAILHARVRHEDSEPPV